ncbi:MAG: hypothetical protein GY792_22015 [Gammaproteobacteria bacterium]|nr:hypothetical protein [Gammaproteobacteria bacterium]
MSWSGWELPVIKLDNPAFTRFEAQDFLTEAQCFFDGVCARCIVDNTLASGSSPDATITPEVLAFGERRSMNVDDGKLLLG